MAVGTLRLVLLLVLYGPAAQAGLAPSLAVSFDGLGPIRVGQPLWRVLEMLEEPVSIQPVVAGCSIVQVGDPGTGISFMVVDGIVTRVEVERPTHATVSGIRVGDSEADVLARYRGRTEVDPHEYEEGHYVTVRSADGKSGVVFDTDGVTVRSFRAGRFPEVGWVEGCS